MDSKANEKVQLLSEVRSLAAIAAVMLWSFAEQHLVCPAC